MSKINLLPWRAERRKQRQQEFYVMLGMSALIAALLSFFIIGYYNSQISGQNDRNAFLQGEIDKVQKQIDEIKLLDEKKARLLARKKVIEELQVNRYQMVHLFDSLVRTIPDGVILTGIKQEGEQLTLEGRSQSNARVATYMRNLEGSGWMTNPEVNVIEAKDADKAVVIPASNNIVLPYAFTLQVKLANPNAPKEGEAAGTAPAATPPAAAPAAAKATGGASS
ncbi:PilN domain-containing protein [Luteimonas sp. SX5]|uniref:PilN domain-containing protein n=1 Tax=Luteimonas galliterrae TaxID=2940486 RepID=A0ABT0MKL9_9GAMM|nr:PilN domain-containing protein [Luteimonas galliterrae]MCL1635421.1 PilN domain-containing protein [Luteimonas galliterrae]